MPRQPLTRPLVTAAKFMTVLAGVLSSHLTGTVAPGMLAPSAWLVMARPGRYPGEPSGKESAHASYTNNSRGGIVRRVGGHDGALGYARQPLCGRQR
jgi:hypothetical protein